MRHEKQMESLRFLLNNRFNARGGSDSSLASVPAAPEHRRVAPNSRQWAESGVPEPPRNSSDAAGSTESGSFAASAASAAVAASTTDAAAGSDSAEATPRERQQYFGPRAAPFDEEADAPIGEAAWHEPLRPIGYLKSCFRRKVWAARLMAGGGASR